jgi:glycosyltransferase involved in cell wall biosynthesis
MCGRNFENYNVHPISVSYEDRYSLLYSVESCFVYLDENAPDIIVNVGKPFPLGIAITIAGKLFGVPSLLRVTGDIFYQIPLNNSWFVHLRKIVFHRWIAASIYRRADHLATVGQNLRHIAIEHGASPNQVSVLPQPFDPTSFEPVSSRQDREFKKQVGLNPERATILSVGRLSYGKGADRLASIVRGVGQHSSRFQFCILGAGPHADLFNGLSDDLLVGPKTVPHSVVPDYFRAADLLVHPTRRDGLPNVILEALAAEVPIAAAPVGEIPNYVESTMTEPDEYVDHILSEEWPRSPKPKWFDQKFQKRRYMAVLERVASS